MKAGVSRRINSREVLFFLCFLIVASMEVTPVLYAQVITAGEVLTLNKAIEIALQNQPAIVAQANQVQAGEAKIGQSQAGYFPQINISTGYMRVSPVKAETSVNTSQAGMPPGTSIPSGLSGRGNESFNQYSATGNVNQLLFDFGKTGSQVKVQKLNTEAIRFNLLNTKDQVIFNVRQAYYSLLYAEHARIVAVETVDNFRNHLKVARGYYLAGMKPRFDVTKAEVDLTSAELNLIKAENNVRVSRVNLNNTMGLFQTDVPLYTLEDDVSFAPFELTIKDAIEIVYSRRADLHALQKQKEAAMESVRLYQKGYFPTLSGVASYTYVAPEFPLDSGWYAGAYLTFPLFSGFFTKNQIAEARANLEVLNANEQGLKQVILLELEQAFNALKEASESRRKTELSIRQARENHELAAERYRSGIGTSADLSTALVAYANARLADIAALYDYKIAQARIAKAIGRTD